METDINTPLTDTQRDAIIDSISQKIIGRRLEAPAVLFLEMHKPLSFLASQSLLVAMPFIGHLLGPDKISDLSKLLKDRNNVERLISRIEELSMERDDTSRPVIEEQR